MTAQKKQWQMPQLTVLVRSRAEEAVLAACKGTGLGGPGARDPRMQQEEQSLLRHRSFVARTRYARVTSLHPFCE